MIRPGPRNLITDVAGILVGNAEDHHVRSGVTVVLAEEAATAAADVRGGAPATRGASALVPGGIVLGADAVTLSGGSAFGLAAAEGMMSWLAARGRGMPFGGSRVPSVVGAILFDLLNGGDKAWGEEPPYRRLGLAAADLAGPAFTLGNAGAGLGAKAGSLKGGLGSASFVCKDQGSPLTVGAIVAANPLGSVVMPDSPTMWAWALEQDEELGGQPSPRAPVQGDALEHAFPATAPASTAIAVVATDAALTQAQALRLAMMAQDGFARAIRPSHTPFDGDVIFALATGRRGPLDPAGLGRLGMLAADCVARAVARGVFEAESLGDLPGYRSVYGTRLRTGASDR
jgi:L-aminopeptidase/D-esterase-like protein